MSKTEKFFRGLFKGALIFFAVLNLVCAIATLIDPTYLDYPEKSMLYWAIGICFMFCYHLIADHSG